MSEERQDTKPEAKPEAAKAPTASLSAAPAAAPPQSVAMVRLDPHGLEPVGMDQAYRLASVLAKAGIGGVKSAEDALARLLAGRELGIPAMTSIRQLYVFDGKIGMEATLMHALCLRSPLCEYFEHVSTTDEETIFVAKRRGRPEKRHSFTAKKAQDAGMMQRGEHKEKNNYDRWLHQMLEARCKAQLARLVFPDILGGIYTRDELTTGIADETTPAEIEVDAKVVAHDQAAVEGVMRNYDAEVEAFKTKADAAKTKAEFADLRAAIAAADWPAGHKQQAADLYTSAVKRAKEAKPATVPAPATPPEGREPGVD